MLSFRLMSDAARARIKAGRNLAIRAASRLVSLCLAIALALPGPIVTSAQAQSSDDLLDAIAIVEEMIKSLPRGWTSINGLVAETGGDPEALIEWITQSIAYRPYAGVMRAAEGTLLTAQGNALDQALLLAAAIKLAGYEARIVETTIGDADIDALLAQALVTPPAADMEGTVERLETLAEELREVLGAEPQSDPAKPELETEALRDAVIAKARSGAAAVQSALDAAGIGFNDSATQALRTAISTYHFVEWRKTADQPWQGAHPALGAAPAEPGARSRIFSDRAPSDLVHMAEITAIVERETAGAGSTETVGKVSAPIWTLLFRTPVYAAHPMGVSEPSQLIEGPFDEISRFVPTFAGQKIAAAKAFTLDGLALDAEALASPMAEVFVTLGKQMGQGVGALSSESSEDGESVKTRLLAHRLKIDTTGPDTPPQSVIRTLFDESNIVASDPDAARARVHALTQTAQISFDVGLVSDVWLMRTQLEKLRDGLTLLERGSATLDDIPDEITDLIVKSLPLLSAREDLGTVVQFSPTVSILYNQLEPEGAVAAVFDIAIDPRLVLGEVGIDRQAGIEFGLHVSLMEALALIQGRETGVADVLLAGRTAAERLLDRKQEWQVEDRDGRIAIVASGGYFIDVDASTGLAIARDPAGLGQVTNEELLVLFSQATNMLKALAGVQKCDSGPAEARASCYNCVAINATIGTGGALAGLGAGTAATLAGMLVMSSDVVATKLC